MAALPSSLGGDGPEKMKVAAIDIGSNSIHLVVTRIHGPGLREVLDRELREALTTFVNILEDAAEDRDYMSQTSMTVWNEVTRNGGPWRINAGDVTAEDCVGPQPHRNCYINDWIAYLPTASPQDLLQLRNNAVLMGYVNRNKINAVRYASEVQQAVYQIESILKLLAENL